MIEWNTLLTLVTFFPLVGVAIILLMKPLFDRESDQAIRLVATLTSVATFLISLVVLFNFDRSDSGQIQRAMMAGRGLPHWDVYLAHDFGVSAPSVTYVVAESPGTAGPDGRYFPRGSIVLLDELATHEPGSLERGMGYTVPILAERIRGLASSWATDPEGVADDAIFARTGSGAGSIAEEFAGQGVNFTRARKGERVAGWEKMRRMLQDAGKPDQPGLYVSRLCEYWWATVPTLPRDPRKPDDVDSRAADHGADACRYGLAREPPFEVFVGHIIGLH